MGPRRSPVPSSALVRSTRVGRDGLDMEDGDTWLEVGVEESAVNRVDHDG